MRSRLLSLNLAAKSGVALFLAASPAIHAQPPFQTTAPTFNSIPAIAFDNAGPVLRAHTEPLKPFTVAGERGVLVGQQDGAFEAWLLPVKVLSHLAIEASVEGYTVPIDVNQQSAEIEVRPDRTILTYAHIGFTVRQIMFSPAAAPAGTGPVVLFEFDCLHPTDFTFRFTPELRWMWPERNEGVPDAEWVAPAPRAPEQPGDAAPTGSSLSSGFYVLHSDYPDFAAAVTIPGARPGILAPYQERPQVHPVELWLHIDPTRDHGRLFPLLMAIGTDPASASSAELGAKLAALNAGIAATYQTHAESYKKLLANSVSIQTPDAALNEAFQWAVVSIEQLKTHVPQTPTKPETIADPETALVAGYYASGDSARPGFGWFFGRDALYTLFAVNGYGDFALSKSELEFLIHRQRADGKIMHEYSQTAASIDWQSFPYMYAAADATPLFLLAVLDYVHSSGDIAFLTIHRDAIEKAWAFETSHAPGPDQGGNGIYENTQGTGWVESWPGGLPHQEVYLALLDQQASAAMHQIETLLQNTKQAIASARRAEDVAATINAQFYDSGKDCYAFSRNRDGSLDRTTTVYPALAWWTSRSIEFPGKVFDADNRARDARTSILIHPDGCLRQLAAHTLNTDWGLRDVSNEEKIYDGMSYHQGSVWPLFTGWAALAEYRGNQPLAGYQILMENANLTRAQDLGAVTELLSGDFYVPFGRSTSHQLWSSAMVITPVLRGLFGLDIDATTKTITVNPHLPADWRHATIQNLPLPDGARNVSFDEKDGKLLVTFTGRKMSDWHFRSGVSGAVAIEGMLAKSGNFWRLPSVTIPLPPLQAALIDPQVPVAGSRTSHARIVSEEDGDHKVVITMEGTGGTSARFLLARHSFVNPGVTSVSSLTPLDDQTRNNAVIVNGTGSAMTDRLAPEEMDVNFPPGEGWKTITVTLSW
jgi:glycogen debranching enzyme